MSRARRLAAALTAYAVGLLWLQVAGQAALDAVWAGVTSVHARVLDTGASLGRSVAGVAADPDQLLAVGLPVACAAVGAGMACLARVMLWPAIRAHAGGVVDDGGAEVVRLPALGRLAEQRRAA